MISNEGGGRNFGGFDFVISGPTIYDYKSAKWN